MLASLENLGGAVDLSVPVPLLGQTGPSLGHFEGNGALLGEDVFLNCDFSYLYFIVMIFDM